jgi:hypothetical protein
VPVVLAGDCNVVLTDSTSIPASLGTRTGWSNLQAAYAERVAAGKPMPDSELAGINWLVDGVQGTLPRT